MTKNFYISTSIHPYTSAEQKVFYVQFRNSVFYITYIQKNVEASLTKKTFNDKV